jgi:hypothetical protein
VAVDLADPDSLDEFLKLLPVEAAGYLRKQRRHQYRQARDKVSRMIGSSDRHRLSTPY